jgi:hypothetical protein
VLILLSKIQSSGRRTRTGHCELYYRTRVQNTEASYLATSRSHKVVVPSSKRCTVLVLVLDRVDGSMGERVARRAVNMDFIGPCLNRYFVLLLNFKLHSSIAYSYSMDVWILTKYNRISHQNRNFQKCPTLVLSWLINTLLTPDDQE